MPLGFRPKFRAGSSQKRDSERNFAEFRGILYYVLKYPFLRIRVPINVSRPFRRFGVYTPEDVDGKPQKKVNVDFYYENLPFLCFRCGLFDHVKEECNRDIPGLDEDNLPFGEWLKGVAPKKQKQNQNSSHRISGSKSSSLTIREHIQQVPQVVDNPPGKGKKQVTENSPMDEETSDSWEERSANTTIQPPPISATTVAVPEKYQPGPPQHRLQASMAKGQSQGKEEPSKKHPVANPSTRTLQPLEVRSPNAANLKVQPGLGKHSTTSSLPPSKTTPLDLTKKTGKLISSTPSAPLPGSRSSSKPTNPLGKPIPKLLRSYAERGITESTLLKEVEAITMKTLSTSLTGTLGKGVAKFAFINEYGSNLGNQGIINALLPKLGSSDHLPTQGEVCHVSLLSSHATQSFQQVGKCSDVKSKSDVDTSVNVPVNVVQSPDLIPMDTAPILSDFQAILKSMILNCQMLKNQR